MHCIGPLSRNQEIHKLESIQRKAARFVKNDYGRTSSVSQMMQELGWKPPQERRREPRLIMMYKILNNLVAIPPTDHLTFNPRQPRNKHGQQLLHKTCQIDNYKFSFFPNTIKDWNSLTEAEVGCLNLGQFKTAVQKKI